MTATVKIKFHYIYCKAFFSFLCGLDEIWACLSYFISPAPGGSLGIWVNCHEFANYTPYMYIELTEGLLKRCTPLSIYTFFYFNLYISIHYMITYIMQHTTFISLIWSSEQTVCTVIVIHIVRGKIETWYCICYNIVLIFTITNIRWYV